MSTAKVSAKLSSLSTFQAQSIKQVSDILLFTQRGSKQQASTTRVPLTVQLLVSLLVTLQQHLSTKEVLARALLTHLPLACLPPIKHLTLGVLHPPTLSVLEDIRQLHLVTMQQQQATVVAQLESASQCSTHLQEQVQLTVVLLEVVTPLKPQRITLELHSCRVRLLTTPPRLATPTSSIRRARKTTTSD